MSAVQILTVEEADDGSRLDRWFKRQFPHIPHGRVEKLLRKGELRVDGKRSKGNLRISAGQKVRVPPLPDAPDPSEAKPVRRVSDGDIAFIKSLVIYEDADLFALNKPAGIAVQGGTKTNRHIDGMLPALGEGCRLVHRLDRDTSGVLLIAKNRKSAAAIGKDFATRKTEKIYWGITNGVPKPQEGEIKGYIGKSKTDDRFGKINEGMEVMAAVRHGTSGAKYARTLYRVINASGKRAAWVVMQPLTGRTHQLRLHMQILGAPLLGDPKYMTDREHPGGLAQQLHLHARSIALPRPGNKELYLEAPLPEHFDHAFKRLGINPNTKIAPFEIED